MKCIRCAYFPCMRIECEPESNCDYYKSIVAVEIERIDSRATVDRTTIYRPKQRKEV